MLALFYIIAYVVVGLVTFGMFVMVGLILFVAIESTKGKGRFR